MDRGQDVQDGRRFDHAVSPKRIDAAAESISSVEVVRP